MAEREISGLALERGAAGVGKPRQHVDGAEKALRAPAREISGKAMEDGRATAHARTPGGASGSYRAAQPPRERRTRMAHFAKFVSLARTPKELKADEAKNVPMPAAIEQPIYPYGTCISLEDEELDKLGLDADCDVGDTIHLCCMAKVTSCSKRDTSSGTTRRVELQITEVAIEDEDAEGAAAMSSETRIKGRYKPEGDAD